MYFKNNPFYILKLPCTANRRDILSASEELSFYLDPEVCTNAQNELINPSKRLKAEIRWFIINLNRGQIENFIADIDAGKKCTENNLPPHSRLNIALYNFSIQNYDVDQLYSAIIHIDSLYSQLNVEDITESINKMRNTAKLASVEEKNVSEEINRLRSDIRQLIAEKTSVLDRDSYVQLVTNIAEAYIDDESYESGVILDDVVDQYELETQEIIETMISDINLLIQRTKETTADNELVSCITDIETYLKTWEECTKPLQVKARTKGLSHGLSKQLAYDIRNLAIYLHNERGKTALALTLTKTIRDVFSDLTDISDIISSDLRTLSRFTTNNTEKNVTHKSNDGGYWKILKRFLGLCAFAFCAVVIIIFVVNKDLNKHQQTVHSQYQVTNGSEVKNDLGEAIVREKEKKPSVQDVPEVAFSAKSAKGGEAVYADIVSIIPQMGIYKQGSIEYESLVCKCKTTAGKIIWVHIETYKYREIFDSSISTNIYDHYAKKIFTHAKKRVHGTAVWADNIAEGVSEKTCGYLIKFDWLGKIPKK